MNPNPSTATPPQSTTLTLHILLERTEVGKTIASILELPNCSVEEPTDEQAIESLKKMVASHLEKIEVIPLKIEIPQSQQTEKPWMKFAGVFKDDPDFDEIVEELRAERNLMDDE
ncbi:hypothetical protein C7H19_14775 [Aphanothece hegewaldii CCALA 016]|uniref:HicB family protein n=1 Tax=Aphanothece hegewaldii CCALA 016 TaxID=2107694 RepID=A0A2T1LVX2_9CHRO|nr:hypothetical protein [Aphanothece hegewaldii]PSF36006.1 hypothetical protein C7H19_14775 [Aphanothece hegewaldii CCALA 016]